MFVNQMFPLGQIVATPAALEALQESGEEALTYLKRHAVGDWGVVDSEDAELNRQSIEDGSRILSAYLLKSGEKLWIITDGADDRGRRLCTTVLLPEDY